MSCLAMMSHATYHRQLTSPTTHTDQCTPDAADATATTTMWDALVSKKKLRNFNEIFVVVIIIIKLFV